MPEVAGERGAWRSLGTALAAEVIIFALIAPNFATISNFLEITRLSTELGLLSIALTPVIITGGIDLSVGSMMGLAAVVFGAANRDWHLSIGAAILIALLVGATGGMLNAVLVSRLRIPALIVTLGSLSLFRGIAEGLTHAAVNYSGFPSGFLALGQGYLGGIVPAQLPLFVVVLMSYVMLLHRSTIGRAWYAIGLASEGARYAGIPVERRVGLAYLLSGIMSSIAAIVYVAHLGQARSDAGTGYELDAIAAVVLGGASISGGRGTLWGTLVGLIAISILRNGMQLALLPSELVGIVVGGLLVTTIGVDHRRRIQRSGGRQREARWREHPVGLAIVVAAVLGGLIVAGTWAGTRAGIQEWRLRGHRLGSTSAAARVAVPGVAPGAAVAGAAVPSGGVRARRSTIAVLPKAKGDPYFVSCRAGAEEAARELGVDLIWDGPASLDAAKQNELVESWITRSVDAIAVAVENRVGISTVLRKARRRGIHVLTWDADAEPDAREYFVNQATAEGIGNTLTDEASRLLGGNGDFAIITGALSAANQNEWIAFIRKRLADRHPGLRLAVIRPSDDDRDKAFAETQTILKVYPSMKLVMAISAPAVPGAAEAVRQAGRSDVAVIGLSLPNINKPYVHSGVVQTVVLWNTRDLGYLTVYAGSLLVDGKLTPGAQSFRAGRLGSVQIRASEIILGPPLLFNKGNIDRFDF